MEGSEIYTVCFVCSSVINLGDGVGYMISEGSTKFFQGKVGGIFSIVLNIVVVENFIFFLLHVFVSYLSVLTFCLLILTLTLNAWNIQTTTTLSLSGPVGRVYAFVVGNVVLFAGS